MGAPLPGPASFVTATFTSGSPSTITGCVSSVAGECAATALVTLDADASTELERGVAGVLAIPRCEPEAIVAGDLEYHLAWAGAPREYEGHIASDESTIAARGSGPCRADARLAWWIARYILAASRPASDAPTPFSVTFDASSAETPRFVNATVDLVAAPPTIFGCTASVRGSCRRTHQLELDLVQSARLRALVEDVRAEPCHVPFPAGAAFSLEMSLAYDGRCGADQALALWVANTLDPSAFTH